MNTAEYYIADELTKGIVGCNRNVTFYNWLTNNAFILKFFGTALPSIGTIKKNKRRLIPPEL